MMTTWEIQLIKLYCIVCQAYDSRLAASAQRLSNNFRPRFSDEECITIYLWGLIQRRFEVKAIYSYTQMHLSDWFPRLPSYQVFNKRINFLSDTLREFASMLAETLPYETEVKTHLMDSMPIVVVKGVRSNHASVAKELCNKGYCSSQQMYYYGIKLHVLGQKRYQTLEPVFTSRNDRLDGEFCAAFPQKIAIGVSLMPLFCLMRHQNSLANPAFLVVNTGSYLYPLYP